MIIIDFEVNFPQQNFPTIEANNVFVKVIVAVVAIATKAIQEEEM